ncbi:hypothetical protein KIPE111705_32760 [Kibdelosporangium persicum]|uniref:hypothetical protein n=1 Tax=Kibdelosporangium persicum TaxID=2698649 RepID=UPI0015663BCC|nr:hypothetical protein [Kibdelosporangium persicum]
MRDLFPDGVDGIIDAAEMDNAMAPGGARRRGTVATFRGLACSTDRDVCWHLGLENTDSGRLVAQA